MTKAWMISAVMLGVAALAPRPQSGEEPISVSAVRFYQPGSATTTIEGVCEVRLPVLLRGVSQASRYRMEITVLDSAGLELQRSDWTRDVPATLAHTRGASTFESFGFNAAPGYYRVRVRVTPGSGDPVERTVTVTAFLDAPKVSDLLLATGVRQAPDSAAPAVGEIRRAGMFLRTAPVPRLTPTEATLTWYAEIYPRSGSGAGQLIAEVVTAAGRSVVATAPRPVTFPAEGGRTNGSIDLSGLPEGEYRLRLRLRFGDSTIASEAPFAMGSVATIAASLPQPDAAPAGATDQFEDASEARLDSLAAPLVYLVQSPRELSLYRTLTAEGKRRFLREFWESRDPTAGTPANERRDEFYRAVAYVNEAFRSNGRSNEPGWNSDRGRIYLKYGRWDEILQRPAASPRPFEVWKYTRERPRYYVFQDQTGLGNWQLIGTNDRREQGRENWERILGTDATRDAYAFLGLDIRNLDVDR